MNINDLPGGSPERIPNGPSKISSAHANFGSRDDAGGIEGRGKTHAQHTRDPEVVSLVKKLADSPEIRPEKIAEVQHKIQSGSFFSRPSAEATAYAFLQ